VTANQALKVMAVYHADVKFTINSRAQSAHRGKRIAEPRRERGVSAEFQNESASTARFIAGLTFL
jgi:hypothetical protein